MFIEKFINFLRNLIKVNGVEIGQGFHVLVNNIENNNPEYY